ncbi:Endoplasmic reticulum aminopeptidase 2 [Papilio machaon]|uniref:Endoplasmic reticulum aminopeptidase 2 n=1 Tax=Papilio machaon TaxID=76193 RepID=A0A0N0PEY7_PAPMA|nr:Endoplasmic reticulum aminopeptidase 2 [Papilio machaon]
MDGIQMEPIGKYKADRNGSAKDTDKAREARELEAPVAVCSQRKALCLTALVFTAIFATALLVVYASPQPDCPCAGGSPLIPGQAPTEPETSVSSANNDYKDRIASNGAVFPWRGARLPTFMVPMHYSLWLHPNLTTGELRELRCSDHHCPKSDQASVNTPLIALSQTRSQSTRPSLP